MREYLDEEFAYKELRRCAERALKRYLRPIEERKLRWLARMDCETIEVFVELFKEMREDQSFCTKTSKKFFDFLYKIFGRVDKMIACVFL